MAACGPGSCRGKVPYASKADARRVAQRARDTGGVLRPYECDGCGYWHLTSMGRREFKAYRRRQREVAARKAAA